MRPQEWMPKLSVIPMARIAGGIMFLATISCIGRISRSMPREVFYLILLVAQLFATVPFSTIWRFGALATTLDFSKVIIIFIVIALTLNTGDRLRQVILIQAVSVLVLAGFSVLKPHLLIGRLEGASMGNFSNPNDLALTIVISLPLCLALLFLSKSVLWKVAWAVAMLLMTYALLLTGSRGGFLALIVATTVLLWELAIRGHRRYLLIVAVLPAVILWQFSGATLSQRFRSTFSNENAPGAYESAQQRQQLFWRSVEVTLQHPLFGVGPGNFYSVSGNWHVTHNSFTQMSSEGGVPALVLYVLILWRGFKNIGAAKRLGGRIKETSILARTLNASLAGYVVGSCFASVAYQFVPYFLVAYTIALREIAKKAARRSERNFPVKHASPQTESYPGTEMPWVTCGSSATP